MALADALGGAIIMKYDIRWSFKKRVPIVAFRDRLSIFDVKTKASVTTEKHLMTDVEILKDTYKNKELQSLCFISSEHKAARCLQKAPVVLHFSKR